MDELQKTFVNTLSGNDEERQAHKDRWWPSIERWGDVWERAEAEKRLVFGPEDPLVAIVCRDYRYRDCNRDWQWKPVAVEMECPSFASGGWALKWIIAEDDFLALILAIDLEFKKDFFAVKGKMNTENLRTRYGGRATCIRSEYALQPVRSTPENDPPMDVELLMAGEFDLSEKDGREVEAPRLHDGGYAIQYFTNHDHIGFGVFAPLVLQQSPRPELTEQAKEWVDKVEKSLEAQKIEEERREKEREQALIAWEKSKGIRHDWVSQQEKEESLGIATNDDWLALFSQFPPRFRLAGGVDKPFREALQDAAGDITNLYFRLQKDDELVAFELPAPKIDWQEEPQWGPTARTIANLFTGQGAFMAGDRTVQIIVPCSAEIKQTLRGKEGEITWEDVKTQEGKPVEPDLKKDPRDEPVNEIDCPQYVEVKVEGEVRLMSGFTEGLRLVGWDGPKVKADVGALFVNAIWNAIKED